MRGFRVGEEIGDRHGDFPVSQHPNMDSGDAEVRSEFGESLDNDFRIHCLDPANPLRGLDREGCGAGNPIALVRGDHLDVGGYTRPGRRIKAGDRQHDQRCRGHMTHCKRKAERWKLYFRVPVASGMRFRTDLPFGTNGIGPTIYH